MTSDTQAPTASLSKSGDLTCAVTSVTLTATPATGVTYTWSTGATPVVGTNEATVTAAGTYTVTVTASNGCTATANVEVTSDTQAPTASLSKSGDLTCAVTSITLTATPATGVTYTWSAGAMSVAGTNEATVTTAGTYTVTVTASNGCTSTASIEVTSDTQAPTSSLTKSGDLTCAVTSVTLTATPATGVTYAWSAGATPVAGTNEATVTTAGTYTVTVTASNGCTSMASIEVTSDGTAPNAGLTKSGDLNCTITSATLTATPATGVTYTWSTGATPVAGTNEATVTAAGTYTVTITGTNGCTSTAVIEVSNDNQQPTVGLTKSGDLSCSVTSITLTATPATGATYSWSMGANPVAGTNTALVSVAGTYSVTVTNISNGCSAVQSILVNPAPALPVVNSVMVTQPTCAQNTGSIEVDASGSSTLEFSIDGGVSYQSSPTFTNLDPGNYQVFIRLLSDQACVSVYPMNPVVIQPVPVAPNINSVSAIQPTCIQPTGTIIINGTGGGPLVYSIDNGLNYQSSNVFTGLAPGSYQVVVALQGILSCTATYSDNPVVLIAAENCCTAPTIVCSPQTITFNGQSSITLNASNMVTITGNTCDILSITANPSVISCQQIGQIVPVVITVMDVEQNVSTCIAMVTVGGLPCGWNFNEEGVGCNNGTTSFEFNPGSGTLTGTSTNCYYGPPFSSDATAFAQRTLCGNGSITVRVADISPFGGGWAGIVMRENANPDAKKVQISTNLSSHRREIRLQTGGSAITTLRNSFNRQWLRINRVGNTFSIFTSANGINWVFFSATTIPMPNCILMGVTLSNFNPNSTVMATFSNFNTIGSSNGLLTTSSGQSELPGIYATPEFSVFPNPGNGLFTMDLAQYVGKTVRYEVLNLHGQSFYSDKIDEVQSALLEIDITAQQKGIYFIRVQSEGVPDVVRRVIIQ